MTRAGAHIESPAALETLEEALGRFRSRTIEAASALRQKLAHRVAVVNEACDARREAVESARRDMQDADEDDYDDYANALAEAHREFSDARNAVSRAHAAQARLLATLGKLERLGLERVRPAEHDLRARLRALDGYARTRIEAESAPARNPVAVEVPHGESGEHAGRVILPPRFTWVKIDMIAPGELDSIRSAEDFKKYSLEEVSTALRKVRDEILPRFSDSAARRSDYWAAVDRAAGRKYEDGVQRAFDALFNSKHSVYLERPRGKTQFNIIDGRHRVWTARQSGWDAIPAQVKDLGHG